MNNGQSAAISGETIDYGPVPFMDGIPPNRVFSLDRPPRALCYANQPQIAVWNMAQLGRRPVASRLSDLNPVSRSDRDCGTPWPGC